MALDSDKARFESWLCHLLGVVIYMYLTNVCFFFFFGLGFLMVCKWEYEKIK